MGALGTKLRTAQGGRLAFYCPGCEHAHVVRTGTGPGPRWTFNGDPELPTLSPSVRVFHPAHVDEDDGPKPEETLCHLFLREGRLQFLGDCAHALAGKTVDLPDWPADYGFGGDP